MSRHIPRWGAVLLIAALVAVAGVAASLATSSSAHHTNRLGKHVVAVSHTREAAGEAPVELIKHQDQLAAKSAAPFDRVAPGAYADAVAKRNKAPKASLGTWSPIGSTPLHADSPDYAGTDPLLGAGVSQLGWHTLSGRITAWTYDPSTSGRIFAAPATGGVWESTDGGSSWRSIGDTLPTGAMGGVAYSKANGGTLIAGTGDSAVGGIFTPTGLGVYTSTNDGKSWTKATGVPDGLVVYRVAVDPNNANVNYVATSKGLYRSTNNGVSYTNVVVPTTCTDVNSVQCNFANTITDVSVQPGTGAVIAVAGWAYGQLKLKSGIVMAPQNGIYTSPNGAPGTFVFQDPGSTRADQERIRADAGGRANVAFGRRRPGSGPRHRLRARPGRDQDPGLLSTRRSTSRSAGARRIRPWRRRPISTACTSPGTSGRAGRRSCRPSSFGHPEREAPSSSGSSATAPESSPGTTTGFRRTRARPTRSRTLRRASCSASRRSGRTRFRPLRSSLRRPGR